WAPFGESDAGHFQVLLGVGEGVLVFELDAHEQLTIGIEWPGVRLVQILVLRHAPDLRGRRRAVDPAASLADSVIDALLVNRQTHGLDERPDRAWRVRV